MSTTCNKLNIVKGEDRSFFIRVTEECTGDNYDLTGLTAAKAIFKGVSSNVEITMLAGEISVVSPATNGKLDLLINDTKTAQLFAGKDLTFELELTTGSETRVIQIKKVLNVEARI